MSTQELTPDIQVEMITVTIDGFEVTVPKGTLVIRAAERLGIQIPRFCDHPLLDPVGACRQCLVDIEINGRKFPKPQASCTIPVEPGMVVNTQLTSKVAEKAQEGIMEFLLINHPLDCPVCDKGGECPLQNQAMSNGRGESRYEGYKRTFEKPINISSQVLLDRERCILCARPFDLVSTPSACEHCASGCDMRTDVRRGKTLRRLAGDDASVNEEWNCDKGRWAFKYVTQKDRITTPLVREANGELREASWPEALRVAAAGLEANRAAVLVGGRATVEDAYGYAKFARVALGTNDIDFRARLHSSEERDFLASFVVGSQVSYRDLDRADHILLAGFEPEEESPIVFLRLYKQVRKRGLKITTIAPFASRGSKKLKAILVKTSAGNEAGPISNISGLTSQSVIVVGERLSESHGALSAVAAMAKSSGAKVAWIPRRAGERGALEAGAIGNLLPGGRPVSDTQARVDIQAAWGVDALPSALGRDTDAILKDLHDGNIEALLVGGVDPLDISAHHHDGLKKAFVVSLEIRKSAITEIANVVLPVAAIVEKSGSFMNWEGRSRSFETAIPESLTRSDVRILSMLADEMGTPINLPSVVSAAQEFSALGSWDSRADFVPVAPKSLSASNNEALLSSWRLLLDAGSLQDGETNLAGTAHPSVAIISAQRAKSLGVVDGDLLRVSTREGWVMLPCKIDEIDDDSVWVPRNSAGSRTIATLGIASGPATVVKA